MFPRIDKGPIEYFLLMRRAFNTEEKKHCVRFTFQTNEEFHHFRYNISIEHKMKEGELVFTIKGLKPAGMDMPAIGRAESDIDLFGLDGKYSVAVSKPGQIRNDFAIRIKNGIPAITGDITGSEVFLAVGTAEEESAEE